MRRAAAVVLVTTVAAAALLAGASPAAAHAYLVGSNPADGDRLTSAPSELRLHFSEHVVLAATRIEVSSADGSPVAVGQVRLEDRPGGDTEDPATIVAALPALGADAYRVSWETLSSDDLHRTSGLIVFGVGRRVVAAGSTASAVVPEEVLLRAALLACLAASLGGLLALRVLDRSLGRSLTGPAGAGARNVIARTARAGTLATPFLAVGLVVSQVLASGSGPGALLLSGYGVRWSVRFAGLLLLCAAWWPTHPPWLPARRTALVGGALACLGTALLGHRGSDGGDPVRVVAAAAHVGAALTWAGALGCLAVALVLRRSVRRVPDVLAIWHEFGPPAGLCLGVVVVTGVYLTGDVVISVDAALLTTYGRTLLVKVVLVAGAGLLGLWHHLRLRGPHDLDPPRRTILVEAGALVVVIGLTGLLASAATATEPAFGVPHAPVEDGVSRQAADLQLDAALSPNRRGPALAVVGVFDTRRPPPAPVVGVDIRLGDGSPVAAQRVEDGRWSAPVDLDVAGPTTITVTVLRAGMPQTTARFAWTVPGGDGPRPVVLSHAPVRAQLHGLALGLCAILGAALVLGWAVARHRGRRTRRGDVTEDPRPSVRDDGLSTRRG